MTEALLFVTTGSLLAVGVLTLVIAALTLRDARRSAELAQDCIEYLHEERSRLLVLLREERQVSQEEQHPLPRQEQRRSAEELDLERHARRDAEWRIAHLERELQELRQNREVQRENSPPVPVGLASDSLEKPLPAQRARETEKTSPPSIFPETTDKKSRRAVWMPHPDDGVDRGKAPAGSEAPVRMFRKHYDKYLENYQGYVEMAEKLYQMRSNGEVTPGSPGEREWQKRLRRVNDGVERTAARLDILEEHNPELATDDRISRRASLARRLSEIERSKRGRS